MTYCIHHCTGSGGMFLVKIFAEAMGIQSKFDIDQSLGHYHNAGLGDWNNPHDEICYLGNFYHDYHEDAKIYYTHDHAFVKRLIADHPSIEVVAIRHDEDDHSHITKQAIGKAWPALWTKKEYDKWASGDSEWPPYHKDNLKDPKVYDKLHEQLNLLTIEWHENLDHGAVAHYIDYKTVMGLDNNDLADVVGKIIGVEINSDIRSKISDYQTKNKELYFNE